ncbi:MAG: nitrogen regulation protein NR(II) [Gammaproteobacteria bacterium]|nr:nitrogen regulation protein NR(II) [Gammaproteobacteria bacterium]
MLAHAEKAHGVPTRRQQSRPLDADRSIVDNLTTGVLLLDAGLRLISINPAAEELLDVSANQVLGLPADRLLPDAEVFAAVLARVAATGEPVTEREMRLRMGGDGTVTVDCSVTPLDDAGDARLVVELVQLDRHRQITREEQLLARNESVRALVRGLAHEVRNPLGGLRGAAQLLERELTDDVLKEYTQVIVHEADRLQNLLDRMLGPRTPPAKRLINIHEVTERVHALTRAEAPPGVTVERDYDPSIPLLSADPELLIQATLNVARNAVQAVGEEGFVLIRTRIHRQYTIGQSRHRLVVRIDVSDDGPGVPAELREHVFYPLVTGRADGSGLGLSIAQSLVHQHGGLIECASVPGNTVFSLILPVENDE